MCLAVPNGLPLQQTLFGMIWIGLMAGSAAAFNHWSTKRSTSDDCTNRRPLPSGELSSSRVFSFAAGIGLLGFVTLVVWVNQLTAWLTFASLLGMRWFILCTWSEQRLQKHRDCRDRRRQCLRSWADGGRMSCIQTLGCWWWSSLFGHLRIFFGVGDSSSWRICQGEYSHVTCDAWDRLHQNIHSALYLLLSTYVYCRCWSVWAAGYIWALLWC